MSPEDDKPGKKRDLAQRLRSARLPSNPLAVAIDRIGTLSGKSSDVQIPKSRHEHAFIISHLFMALRFAFLQDNDVLPLALRAVQNPISGEIKRVKTHDKAAAVRGERYTFRHLWLAFKQEGRRKVRALPATATLTQRSEAYKVEYDIKRRAHEVGRLPAHEVKADVREALSVLNDDAVRGLLAR